MSTSSQMCNLNVCMQLFLFEGRLLYLKMDLDHCSL